MPFWRTEAERSTLKAFVAGDATLNGHFTAGRYQELADALIADASPAYYGVRTDASVRTIKNAILWPRYTPAPAISGANAAQHTACSNACMAKLTVLQSALGLAADGSYDATQATLTNGIKDATTALPSAASFATQDAGWVPIGGTATPGVANALVRKMRVCEKVFAADARTAVTALYDGVTARGGWNTATALGAPDLFGPEGTLQAGDIGALMA